MVCILAGVEIAEAAKERHGNDVDLEQLYEGFDTNVKDLHNREVNVYRIFSRFDSSLSKIPRLFFAQEFTEENLLKGFIGMECVENVEIRQIFDNITPKEMSDILRALAYNQASSLQFSSEERRKLEGNPVETVYPTMVKSDDFSKMIQELYSASEDLKPAGEKLAKMVDEMFVLELTSTMNKELGMEDVFVHGDLWSGNLLWTKTAGGLRLSKVVDYQAAEDLTRVFISMLSGKDRREKWENLLEEFHGYLKQYCTGHLPFNLDQLKGSYRRMFPLAGLLMIPVYDTIAKIGIRKVSEDAKLGVKTVLLEKTIALFEDILFFANRNREVRRNVKN
ncbi:hypothetical protein ANCCAN_21639 [Ancylostoma caninum]|uniref:CHK kinase-like domain-containing protein n=1 Tax=Ancylostoma caninum TaxID=29170 RepID=A0A368FLZ3_ANCCA|nr:hypothetical protein ANCCAN_21639 [Ancylostoma caninum]